MRRLLKKLVKDTRGAPAIEYGFLAALIALAAMVSMEVLGGSVSSLYDEISSAIFGSGDDGDKGKGKGKGGKGKDKGG